MQKIYDKLILKIDKERILKDEPMKKHTTLKIGGPADFYIKVNNVDELKYILKVAKEKQIPITVIGNGSNVLVKDGGIRGFVLKLNFLDISFEENKIINIGSGVKLSKLANEALKKELTGSEFIEGIPGTIGGAIKMNAGAYGKEIKDIILTTTYINKNLEIKTISNNENNFQYRKSRFTNNKEEIIISARISLEKGKKIEIENLMKEYKKTRVEKQPIDAYSAGSSFKRGKNFITARLIDKCGLKGYKIGNAEVSTKHAGFIINSGNAKAIDVLNLAEYIKEKVQEKFNKNIELEIDVLGED